MMKIQISWFCCYILVSLWITATSAAEVGFSEECDGSSGNTCSSGYACKMKWKNCTIGLCSCEDGYIYDANKCKKVLEYDEGDCSDTDNNVCLTNLACLDTNKCGCDVGPYDETYGGLCLDGKLSIGQTCDDTDNATDDNAMCESGVCDSGATGKCICDDGQKDYDGNGYCRKPYYGEECTPGTDACMATDGTTVECAIGETECTCTGSKVAWTDITQGCKDDGSAEEGETCSTSDDCEGDTMVCGLCESSGGMACRNPYLMSGTTNVKESLSVLMAGIALSILYF